MRKIIQIQEIPETEYVSSYLMALCDDGTVWYYSHNEWSRLPEIPQD